MYTLRLINYIISIVFVVCFSYQALYVPVSWWMKKPIRRKKTQEKRAKVSSPPSDVMTNHYAIMICGRNESSVIGDLIHSIQSQTYPAELLDIFIMADNCTDNTAEICRQMGAHVYTRTNDRLIGKGYALTELRRHMNEDYPEGFDGYFIFDADNILNPDYIEQMDKVFSQGSDIVTGYRNSKNYGDNWISSGYALWFLRESRYLNHPRDLLNTSCAVSGTGFMFSRKVAEELVDWPYHLLTEDVEFSVNEILKGRRIAFCKDAVLYDEQPRKFMQSWRQRLRWTRGYYQLFVHYGLKLIGGIFRGSFACLDLSVVILTTCLLSAVSVIANLALSIVGTCLGQDPMIGLISIGQLVLSMYLGLILVGGITLATEWKKIETTTFKKIKSLFTFPFFMFTYIPISIAAFFFNPGWKPIEHTVSAKEVHSNRENLKK